MDYQEAKIYSDGSHYIAIPKNAFPHGKGCKRRAVKRTKEQSPAAEKTQETLKERFERAYKESLALPKRERRKAIKEALQSEFNDQETLSAYVKKNVERIITNSIRRKIRLLRKLYLQEWNYFCTFTYDDKLHTEESFKKKLSNTLKHLVYRNGWKYIGVWERSPEKQRLHFHGIFYIPQMIGTIEKIEDYSTKSHRKQTTFQNSHFLKHFGRNDFEEIIVQQDVWQAAKYITKYLEKSGERLVYGGKLPSYFLSDLLESDIACPYGVDDRKALLFDDFTCIIDGEIIGKVSKEVIAKMPKSN